LEPIERSRHGSFLEFFGANHSHEEVNEKQQRHDADDEIPHNIDNYNFSQKRTYNAAITKKPTITPTKIKSFINLERLKRRSLTATWQWLSLSGSKKPRARY
jgi:hypothetical protein